MSTTLPNSEENIDATGSSVEEEPALFMGGRLKRSVFGAVTDLGEPSGPLSDGIDLPLPGVSMPESVESAPLSLPPPNLIEDTAAENDDDPTGLWEMYDSVPEWVREINDYNPYKVRKYLNVSPSARSVEGKEKLLGKMMTAEKLSLTPPEMDEEITRQGLALNMTESEIRHLQANDPRYLNSLLLNKQIIDNSQPGGYFTNRFMDAHGDENDRRDGVFKARMEAEYYSVFGTPAERAMYDFGAGLQSVGSFGASELRGIARFLDLPRRMAEYEGDVDLSLGLGIVNYHKKSWVSKTVSGISDPAPGLLDNAIQYWDEAVLNSEAYARPEIDTGSPFIDWLRSSTIRGGTFVVGTLLLSAIPGVGPSGAAVIIAGGIGASTYGNLDARGIHPALSLSAAGVTFATSYFSTKFQLDNWTRYLGGRSPFGLFSIGTGLEIAAESGQEFVENMGQTTAESLANLIGNDQYSTSDFWREMNEGFKQSLSESAAVIPSVAGMRLFGFPVAARNQIRASAFARAFNRSVDMAARTGLFKSSPDVLANSLTAMAAHNGDARVFSSVIALDQSGITRERAIAPVSEGGLGLSAELYDEAKTTGETIAFPYGSSVVFSGKQAEAGNKNASNAFAVSPDAMTVGDIVRQREEAEAVVAEAEAYYQEELAGDSPKTPLRIRVFKAGLRAAGFDSHQAAALTAIYRRGAERQADLAGVPVEEWLKRKNVRLEFERVLLNTGRREAMHYVKLLQELDGEATPDQTEPAPESSDGNIPPAVIPEAAQGDIGQEDGISGSEAISPAAQPAAEQSVEEDIVEPIPETGISPMPVETPADNAAWETEAVRNVVDALDVPEAEKPGVAEAVKQVVESVRPLLEAPPAPAPAPAQTDPGVGVETDIIFPAETGQAPLLAHYELVEADSLLPSHTPRDFRPNDKWGGAALAQQRNYDSPSMAPIRASIQTDRLNFPSMFNPTTDAVNGPPVITPDGMVLGGNNRTLRILNRYDQDNYKTMLEAHLRSRRNMFGISAEAAAAMDRPVLVRVADNVAEADIPRLIGALNADFTTRRDAGNLAANRGLAVGASTMNAFKGIGERTVSSYLDDPDRAYRVVTAMRQDGVFQDTDLVGIYDFQNGKWLPGGKAQVEQALFGAILPDSRLLDEMTPAIQRKILKALPALVRLKASGSPELATLFQAVQWHNEYQSFRESSLGKQFKTEAARLEAFRKPDMRNMFTGELEAEKTGPAWDMLLEIQRAKSQKEVAEFFAKKADELSGQGRGLFGSLNQSSFSGYIFGDKEISELSEKFDSAIAKADSRYISEDPEPVYFDITDEEKFGHVTLALSKIDDGPPILLIDGLYLNDEVQKKGLGSIIFSEIENAAYDRNIEKIVIESVPESVGFWEKMGFEEGGFNIGAPLDVPMSKFISKSSLIKKSANDLTGMGRGLFSLRQEAVNEKRAKFDAVPMIETESGEIKKIPTGEGFNDRLVQWARDNGVFGTYANDDTGWSDIEVDEQSIRDVNYHHARSGKLSILQAVGDLIKNGVYLETTRRNPQLISHVFAGRAKVDGVDYVVGFSINEDMNGKRYYNHELTQIERLSTRFWPGRQPASGNSANREPISSIVRRHLFVNPESDANPPIIETLYQSAYHGSPYRFDKFSLDSIGSGEGAQAYGWGLYFAGNREVSEEYREKLSEDETKFEIDGIKYEFVPTEDVWGDLDRGGYIDVGSGEDIALNAFAKYEDVEEATEYLEWYLKNTETHYLDVNEFQYSITNEDDRTIRETSIESVMEAIELLRSGEPKKLEKGQLYKVEIPEDGFFLDWDKLENDETLLKIAAQAEKEGLEDLFYIDDSGTLKTPISGTGEFIYKRELTRILGSDRKASEFLNRAGIEGIKYLDGSSRNAGEGSHNYVIFDDNAINILETYYQSAASANSDERYFAAIESGDMETARRIVDEQAARNGYSPDINGRMNHRAPNSADEDITVNVANLMNSDIVPRDFWTHPEYYITGDSERQSFGIIKRALDSGAKTIRMYRAIPKSARDGSFRNGDWITPSRIDAETEGGLTGEGGYRIISEDVSVENIWWDGNSINEFGYDDARGYAYRNTKNNRKLNAVIVRDNNGNIVPPSKRFNARSAEAFYQNNDAGQPGSASLPGNWGSISFPAIEGDPTVIRLFKGANVSTVVHELNHLFIHDLANLVKAGKGGETARGHFDALNRFADGNLLSDDPDKRRASFEKIARAWEHYAMTAEAPSPSLEDPFAVIRKYMAAVYRNVLESPLAEPSPEVRRVFDRMLATDRQIEDAAKIREIDADWTRAGQSGERVKSRMASINARRDARRRKRMDARQGGGRAMRNASRLDAVRRVVKGEMASEPVYRAIDIARARGGMSRAGAVAVIGEAAVRRIEEEHGDGVFAGDDADGVGMGDVAASAGYTAETVADMLSDMAGAKAMDSEADSRARREQATDDMAEDIDRDMRDEAEGDADDLDDPGEETTGAFEEWLETGVGNGPVDADEADMAEEVDLAIEDELSGGEDDAPERELGERLRAWRNARSAMKRNAYRKIFGMSMRGAVDVRGFKRAMNEARRKAMEAALAGKRDVVTARKKQEMYHFYEMQAALRARALRDRILEKYSSGGLRGVINAIAPETAALRKLIAAGYERDQLRLAMNAAERDPRIEYEYARSLAEVAIYAGFGNSKFLRDTAGGRAEAATLDLPSESDELSGLVGSFSETLDPWLTAKERPENFRDFRDFTVERLMEIDRLMRWLIDNGRGKLAALNDADTRNLADLMEQSIAPMRRRKDRDSKTDHDERTRIGGPLNRIKKFLIDITIPENWFMAMDGNPTIRGGAAGVNQRKLFETMLKADTDRDLLYRDKVAEMKPSFDVTKEIKKRLEKKFGGKLFAVPGLPVPEIMRRGRKISTWDADLLLSVALQMGNDANLRRLLTDEDFDARFGTNITPEGGQDMSATRYNFTNAQLDIIAGLFTDSEWDAIQGIWDGMDSLYGRADAVTFDLTNRHIKKEKAVALRVTTADGKSKLVRGGYFPIVNDPELSDRAAKLRQGQTIEDYIRSGTIGNVYGSARNEVGALKSRARNEKNVPMATLPQILSTKVIVQHIDAMAHYITHARPLRDIDRLTRSDEWRRVYVDKFGQDRYDAIRLWVKNLAAPERGDASVGGRFMERMRSLATVNALGLRWKTGLKQRLGAFQAASFMGDAAGSYLTGWKFLKQGIVELGRGNLGFRSGAINAVNEKSEYMSARDGSFDREMRAMREKLSPLSGEFMGRSLGDWQNMCFFWIQANDRGMAYAVWLGAYKQAAAGKAGFEVSFGPDGRLDAGSEAEAVRFADSAARTQASSFAADLTKIQRDRGFMRFMSMFMSGNIRQGSRLMQYIDAHRMGDKTKGDIALLAAKEFVFPALSWVFLAAAAKWAMAAALGMDDDDEDLLKEAFWETLDTAASPFPLLREAPRVVRYGYLSGDVPAVKSTAMAIGDAFGAPGKLAEAEYMQAVGKAMDAAGYAFGIPVMNVFDDLGVSEAIGLKPEKKK